MTPYYEEDGITIYHGDCREILPEIGCVDMVLTDPPYGINLKPQRASEKKYLDGQLLKKTCSISNDDKSGAMDVFGCVLSWMEDNVPDNSAHFIFAGWSETWVQDMIKERFTLKSAIVWEKNMFGIGYHTRPQYELIYLVHNGKPARPVVAKSDIWKFAKVHKAIHSCEKPTNLIKECILYYDGISSVIDPFMGSGTTLFAAKELGRKAIGIEIEEKYCEMAVKKLKQEVLAV